MQRQYISIPEGTTENCQANRAVGHSTGQLEPVTQVQSGQHTDQQSEIDLSKCQYHTALQHICPELAFKVQYARPHWMLAETASVVDTCIACVSVSKHFSNCRSQSQQQSGNFHSPASVTLHCSAASWKCSKGKSSSLCRKSRAERHGYEGDREVMLCSSSTFSLTISMYFCTLNLRLQPL